MKAHVEDAELTVDGFFHDDSRRLRPMADELARIAGLTRDDPETFKAAADATAVFQGMMSRFEESGLAKMAKDAAEMMDAINGQFAKELGKSTSGASSKMVQDRMEGLGSAHELLAAHEVTSKWLTHTTLDSMKEFGAAKLGLRSEGLLPKLKSDYMSEMAPTKMEKFMRWESGLKSELGLLEDRLRGFDDLRGKLDSLTGLESLGRVSKRSAFRDRHRSEMTLADLPLSYGSLVVPVPSITIIERKYPVVLCRLCRETVEAEYNRDGTLEILARCDCGLLQALLKDLADAPHAVRRPALTVFQGDRPDTDGPGIPTGDLRIVRPVPDPTTNS